MAFIDDNQRIGILLSGLGLLFTFLGIVMLFDRGLLAIGNLLFLSGVAFVIGFKKTGLFFFQKRKIRGSVLFFGGIVLVLIGWAKTGILVEAFGFVNLFGDFFPVALAFMRRLPFIGTLLNLPFISQVIDRVINSGRSPA